MVQVVAALIWNNDRFMACQRPSNKAIGLMWEFVGGKVEAGESREEALRRECIEELGIEIDVRNVYYEVDHVYPDISIHLTLFNAQIRSGAPQLLEHNDLRWILPSEIPSFDFCPADTEILERIQRDSDRLNKLRKTLSDVSDSQYKQFNCSLMPTVDPDRVLGVRMPKLRSIAKGLSHDPDWFLSCMPLRYFEEQNLYGIFISACKDYSVTIKLLEQFLPYVDNWATCDLIVPVSFRKNYERACQQALGWLSDKHTYTVRFSIGVLMRFGMNSTLNCAHADAVCNIHTDEYYVKMMIAWYFATALSKDYDSAVRYLEQNRLPKWVHNKTIQKAIESYRITPEQKIYLRTLRK